MPRPPAPRGTRPANMADVVLAPGSDVAPAFVGTRGVVTRGGLRTDVEALSGWLAGQGVGRGDRVVLALPDGVPWVASFIAIVRIGAVAALVAPSVDAARATDLALRADPRLVLSDRDDLAVAPVAPVAGTAEVDAAMRSGPSARGAPSASVRTTDPCYLLATSGSTGPSKWVVHRHGDIPACIATFGRSVMRLGPGDVTWSVAALATSYGLGNALYFPLGAGAAAWLGGGTDPAALATACRLGGVTAVYGVPTFWARLARHVREGRFDPGVLARVSHAGSAGENLPATVWNDVARDTGLRIVNGLGSSEATNLYLSDTPGAPRAGTVGWPVAGYDLCIDGRRPLPGDEGELWVRGPTVMDGYLGDRDATARALTGGWLRTGDRVRMEADRSFTFLGRLGDVIKVGALWVDPAHVQDVVLGDPEVADAVVLAAPDADGIDRLVAVVGSHAEPGWLEARLHGRCADLLPAHMVPRAVVVADHLPVTPSGKVRRDQVMTMATDRLAGAGAR